MIHDDLLVQARYLITHDRGKPKQASLRRAVSTAYYALFHLLTEEASNRLVKGTGRDVIRMTVRRSFSHTNMANVCEDIAKSTLPNKLKPLFPVPANIPPELINVATAFKDLQQARHEADYNLLKPFSRLESVGFVEQAETAFSDWKRVRKSVEADIFLTMMLIYKKGSASD